MARVPQHVHDALRQAAGLPGMTQNQFVVQAALGEAQRVIERARVIRLTGDDAMFLLKLLENPPAPNVRPRQAFRNYKRGTAGAAHTMTALRERLKPGRQRKR